MIYNEFCLKWNCDINLGNSSVADMLTPRACPVELKDTIEKFALSTQSNRNVTADPWNKMFL